MTPEEYAKVKAVFIDAIELPPDQRLSWLDQVCGKNSTLRQQVDGLLRHHFPDSILSDSAAPVLKPALGDEPNPTKSHFSIPRLKFWSPNLSKRNQVFLRWVGPLSIGLLTLGGWFYRHMHKAFEAGTVNQLELGLNAEVNTLELWIDRQILEAERYALSPPVRSAALDLVQLGQIQPFDSEQLAHAPARSQLYYALEPYFHRPEIVFATLIDPAGIHLAESGPDHQSNLGLPLSDKALGWLNPVFEQRETIFLAPFLPQDVLDNLPDWTRIRMPTYTAVATPMADSEGNIVATLVFGTQGHDEFSRIFETANVGQTAEAYAFNAEGKLLSRSRFNRLLMEAQPDLQRINNRKELLLSIGNPGGDLLKQYQPIDDPADWPLTNLAEAALREQPDATAMVQGTILTPYLNYRGARVVGAWAWLPEHNLGVAFEVEAKEVYGPLRLINLTLVALTGLSIIGLAWATCSAHTASTLNRQTQQYQQLGQYKLLKKIDEGGMGEVYLSRHALLKRPTAIKILKADRLSKEAIARFNQEVQIASQLDHPNVIDIFDFGYTPDGVIYYVMEYIDGFNLAELVAITGPLPPARTIHILLRVCDALAEAHGAGLIHRDIKPSNIMVYRRGQQADVVKLLDFGLAKSLTTIEGGSATTQPLHRVGTPLYMAPERWSNLQPADIRSDIYSIGAVAYYLLTGQAPFPGAEGADLLYQVMNESPQPLADICSSPIPDTLQELVMRCLAKNPAQRPPSMTVVVSGLEHLQSIHPWDQSEAQDWWQNIITH